LLIAYFFSVIGLSWHLLSSDYNKYIVRHYLHKVGNEENED